MTAPLRSRQPAPDLVRAIAIVMVLIIHAATAGLSRNIGSADWWGSLVWGSLARPAVPLFFMCSGALMLSRDLPLKRLYGHNFLRILVALLFWAFAYKASTLPFGGGGLAGLWPAVKETLLFQHESHFYYLHILLLVYAFVPVVRTFVRSAARKELRYLLILWAVVGVLFPLLRAVPPFSAVYLMSSNWYVMNMAYSAIGYGVLGYYLSQYGADIPHRWYWISLAAGLAIVFGGTAALSLPAGALVSTCMEGMSPGPMLMALGIMGLAYSKKTWSPKLCRFTGRVAAASFCIYLTHMKVLYLLDWAGLSTASHSALLIPAVTIIMLVVCYIAWEVLHRIPIVKTWLV